MKQVSLVWIIHVGKHCGRESTSCRGKHSRPAFNLLGGNKLYIQSMEQNQIYLKSITGKENFLTEHLRREPPRNYGVDNFPGLDAFDLENLNVHSNA